MGEQQWGLEEYELSRIVESQMHDVVSSPAHYLRCRSREASRKLVKSLRGQRKSKKDYEAAL
jgi:hypothetical protein